MSPPLNIPLFNTFEVDLPAWLAVPTKNYGKKSNPVWFRLANPMTTSRNLSNRQHDSSIDLSRRAGLTKPEIKLNDWDHKYDKVNIVLEHFNALDQSRIKKMEEHSGELYTNYPVLSRGRPEVMAKNVDYNKKHSKHDTEQKYGKPFLTKVKETLIGKPIEGKDDNFSKPKPQVRSSTLLSSLASSLRSSIPSDSDRGSDEGSDEESDEESEAGKNVFRPNRKIPSKKKIYKPSVSHGKPPLKRAEPNLALTTKVLQQAEKKRKKEEAIAEKKKSKAESTEAKKKATQEAKEAKETKQKEKADKPKIKTKTTKPTPSEAGDVITKKARGRTPKHSTKEEAYKAKLESNKLNKQKKAEEKKAKSTKKDNIELVIKE